MNKQLSPINFSKGIRDKEIQDNFNILQEEIERERVSTGGKGISFGLNITLDNFKLSISEGCIIDKKGKEIYLDKFETDVEKPLLYSETSLGIKKLDNQNNITLDFIPYALSQNTTADNCDISESGISITTEDNLTELKIVAINKNIVTVYNPNGIFSNKNLNIKYNRTQKRLDLVAIDKNYDIKIIKGVSSSSPSIVEMEENDAIAVIGYLSIDPFFINKKNYYEANCSFTETHNFIRNIYTDKNNKLFLCGTPFSSIKTINMSKPENPEDFSLWYDFDANQLKIFRKTDNNSFSDKIIFLSENPNHPQIFKTIVPYIFNFNQLKVYVNEKLVKIEEGPNLSESEKYSKDYVFVQEFKILDKLNVGDNIRYEIDRFDGFSEWVPLNSTNFLNAKEVKLWTPDVDRHSRFFIFDYEQEFNYIYIPNKNCIEIMIDQIPLHKDQFEEITFKEVKESKYESIGLTLDTLKEVYHFPQDDKFILEEEYQDIGIGFTLKEELDTSDSYVEARISQRYNAAPLTSRFQRSATFISTGYEKFTKFIKDQDETKKPVFYTKTSYKYKENQLEVFLNGKKLINEQDYEEGYDLDSKLKGADSFLFKIKDDKIKDGDIIEYKISTNVYSYGNLKSLFGNFDKEIERLNLKIESTEESLENKKKEIDYAVKDIKTSLENIKKSTEMFNDFIDESDKFIQTSKENIEKHKKELKAQTEKVNNNISIIDDKILNLDKFLKNIDEKYLKANDKIGFQNLESQILTGLKNGLFAFSIEKNNTFSFNVSDHCAIEDYVDIIDITDKVRLPLVQNLDYRLVNRDNFTFLELINNELVNNGILYISGINFNLERSIK